MRKMLLILIILSSLLMSTENANSDPITNSSITRYQDSITSFFESRCMNNSINSLFSENTLVDIKGSFYEVDTTEFKDIVGEILLKYNPSKCWIYKYDPKYPSYYSVIGTCKDVMIIFTFEMVGDKLDIIHIYKKKI